MGSEQDRAQLFLGAGENVARQSFVQSLEGGAAYETNVYPPLRSSRPRTTSAPSRYTWCRLTAPAGRTRPSASNALQFFDPLTKAEGLRIAGVQVSGQRLLTLLLLLVAVALLTAFFHETAGVSIRFGGVQALADVDLRADQWEIVGIIGPNGAGKTTLFNCITGFYEATSGTVHFMGEDVTELPVHLRSTRGMSRTFQNVGLVREECAMALLEIHDLVVGYEFEVLHSVSFSVEEGETAVLFGLNGAGKTTTVTTVAGVRAPWSGRIVFDGEDIGGRFPSDLVKAGISLSPEGRRLFPRLTVEDNLRMGQLGPARRQGRVRDPARPRLRVLPQHRRAPRAGRRHPVGGRAADARHRSGPDVGPRLLLIDEASLGLSPALAVVVSEVVTRICGDGTTVVIVEQNVGVLLVFLGWNGAASVDRVEAQFPYLLSGGIAGLSLVIIGVGLIVVQNQRSDRALLQQTLRELEAAIRGEDPAETDFEPPALRPTPDVYAVPRQAQTQARTRRARRAPLTAEDA